MNHRVIVGCCVAVLLSLSLAFGRGDDEGLVKHLFKERQRPPRRSRERQGCRTGIGKRMRDEGRERCRELHCSREGKLRYVEGEHDKGRNEG